MSTTTRQEILDLLANGKITAVEAADMLNAVTHTAVSPDEPLKVELLDQEPAKPATPKSPEPPEPPAVKNGLRWFHVKVRDLESGKNKVSVNIPLPLVKFGFSVGRRFAPELQGLDWDDLESAMQQTEQGILVDVQDEESNEHVQVYID